MRKFSFGKNWQIFLKSINNERIENAKESISEFMNIKDFKNKTFLDIGCGSGLFSYSALKLGAKNITSFDVDSFSIKCCKYLKNKANNPQNWKIIQGSILDKEFINNLEKYDIVYSWGVLHHTGNMWQAIKNSAALVKKGGYFYIAVYNKVNGKKGSKHWLKIKKFYNSSPKIIKYIIESRYILEFLINNIKNPIRSINEFKSKRGMSWLIDLRDWIGGYPYEFATIDEILSFMKKEFPDFKLINIKKVPENSLSNNWFLFKRK